MECTVRWMGNDAGMSFVAESGSGHAVVMDGAPEAGGRNLGFRPMEMVLAGTGGCSAFDVVLILKKGRARRQWLRRQPESGTRRRELLYQIE